MTPGNVVMYERSNRVSLLNTVFIDPMVWGGAGGGWLGYAIVAHLKVEKI